MEENQNPEVSETMAPQEEVSSNSGVSFPTVGQPKKSGSGKAFLIIGTLILVAILGFVIFKSAGNKEIPSTDATPIEGVTNDTVSTPEATPTPSPKTISRAGISIEVQNGTGISGDAAYLQTQLKNLGYTDVKTGNAASTGATTTKVTFAKSLPLDVVEELTKKLNELYTKVETATSTSATTDVVIITGLKKGATLPPSASPTVKPSASATPTASASATPTPTPTTGN